jgi:hypothetical protein
MKRLDIKLNNIINGSTSAKDFIIADAVSAPRRAAASGDKAENSSSGFG